MATFPYLFWAPSMRRNFGSTTDNWSGRCWTSFADFKLTCQLLSLPPTFESIKSCLKPLKFKILRFPKRTSSSSHSKFFVALKLSPLMSTPFSWYNKNKILVSCLHSKKLKETNILCHSALLASIERTVLIYRHVLWCRPPDDLTIHDF